MDTAANTRVMTSSEMTICENVGLARSMGSIGDYFGDPVAERFFATLE